MVNFRTEVDAEKVVFLLEQIEKGKLSPNPSRYAIQQTIRLQYRVIGYSQAGRYKKALENSLKNIKPGTKGGDE